jgi:hypothetical protein
MEESILNHSVAISRIEDCEDAMNVCNNDVDSLKLEQASMGRDTRMLEALMGAVLSRLVPFGHVFWPSSFFFFAPSPRNTQVTLQENNKKLT